MELFGFGATDKTMELLHEMQAAVVERSSYEEHFRVLSRSRIARQAYLDVLVKRSENRRVYLYLFLALGQFPH